MRRTKLAGLRRNIAVALDNLDGSAGAGLPATRAPLARYDRIVPSSLAPAFLLSMPQLTDPNFNRTVVLLCKHNNEGAFGLVLNRPLVTAGRVVVNLDPPVETDRELQVWVGGPVEPQSSWILVGDEDEATEGLPAAASPTACASRRHPTCCGGCSTRIHRPGPA